VVDSSIIESRILADRGRLSADPAEIVARLILAPTMLGQGRIGAFFESRSIFLCAYDGFVLC